MDKKRKKEFAPCKIDVIPFEKEDVISTSGFSGEEQDLGFGKEKDTSTEDVY